MNYIVNYKGKKIEIKRLPNGKFMKPDFVKELSGGYSGNQMKPAYEKILVCMKPLSEKTYIDQALKNKKGITWLDDCRIPYKNEKDRPKANTMPDLRDVGKQSKEAIGIDKLSFGQTSNVKRKEYNSESKGRFPSNILVSDDILNDGRVISYGEAKEPYSYQGKKYQVKGFIKDNSPQAPSNYSDSGSFSRYFSLDAWWQEKLKQLPESVQKTFPFLIVSKASKNEKNKGLEGFEKKHSDKVQSMPTNQKCSICGGWKITGNPEKRCKCDNPSYVNIPAKNNHPTVKPIQLMSYLITLGSRKDDIVLDPFMGSGTTCIAAKMLGRNYIGIERESDYCVIARARVNAVPVPLLY